MKVNVWNTIMQLSKERSVEPRLIIQAIEESLRVASSQYFSQKENVQILFKPEKGELRVFVIKRVTESPKNTALEVSLDEARAIRPDAQEGETVEVDLPSDTLGRIAAQAAKKVIFQKVRDAEQDKIYGDFAPRIGEIVTGVVRRIEDGVIILEVNRIEVSFPLRETLPNEEHRRGDLVKAVIVQVLKGYQGPQIIVSRANPRFLGRLLETEIPEIANGAIEIKDIVRQPGERSKVAVASRERDVDPIGACIGVKGNRILAISKELQGEKVDIIEWSSDLVSYAKSALSPAKVDRLQVVSRTEKAMLAIVPQDQLSLAIGKKGINVKLASRLIGWKISIKQEDANE